MGIWRVWDSDRTCAFWGLVPAPHLRVQLPGLGCKDLTSWLLHRMADVLSTAAQNGTLQESHCSPDKTVLPLRPAGQLAVGQSHARCCEGGTGCQQNMRAGGRGLVAVCHLRRVF